MTSVPGHMLCIDPGLLTGIANLSYNVDDGITLRGSSEVSPMDVGTITRSWLDRHNPRDSEVVIERFVITARTASNSQAPWSLEVIGIVKWLVFDAWAVDPDEVIVMQSPSSVKNLAPNKLLQDIDLWHVGGQGHANDAIRHGVYRYARHGVRDAWE